MSKTKRLTLRRTVCGAACIAFAMAAACHRPVGKDVAATVNGHPITYAEIDSAIAEQFPKSPLKPASDEAVQLRLNVLRALIDNEILLQQAAKEGLLADDGDVEAKFNQMKSPYTQEEFQKWLKQRKLTASSFKAQIRRQLSIQKLFNKEIGARISISDADVKAFYEKNKAGFNVPEDRIHLAQILVTSTPDASVNNLKNSKAQNDEQARRKIKMIDFRLKQGADFATLAQNYSEDPSAPNGGDLGFVAESALNHASPELRKMILDMTPGQISPIIHTPQGYRIIKVIAKQPAGQRKLSDPRVWEEIRQGLFQAKEQLLRSAYYEVARSKADVVNYYAAAVLAGRAKSE
ncbi:MAG TPA: peptidylprolyl isomerase [Bryobacteraceae bacterium]